MANTNTTNNNGPPRSTPSLNHLIRPEQVHRIKSWTEEQTAKYYTGLTNLWQTIESHPPESQIYVQAVAKLTNVSNSIKHMLQQLQQQENASQQNGVRPQSSGQPVQPGQQPQQGQQGQTASQPQQTPQGQHVPPTSSQSQQARAAPDPAPAATGQPLRYSQKVLDKVKSFKFVMPPQVIGQGQEHVSRYMTDMRKQYAQALQTFDAANERLEILERRVRDRQAQGKPFSPAEEHSYQEQKRIHEAEREKARHYLARFADSQRQIRDAQSQMGNAGNAGNVPMKREASQNGGVPMTTQQDQQSQPHTVSSALDAARNQGGMGGNSGINPPMVGPLPGQLNQSNSSHQPTQTQPTQTQPQTNVKLESRPQDHLLSSPHPNAPAQNQTEVPAFPLTHADAMQQARSYSNPNNNVPHPQNPPQSTPHSQPPNSHMHPATNRENPPSSQAQQKMPIPKEWSIPPPQPVSMGQARPTMTNGPYIPGPIGQPVITKHPGYVLEGEGERVLSKKKLEELVRQVTGSTGSENDEGESLTAEVEETLLQVADDFVDQVIVSACKLAKLRGSSTLELRDLQLILERNYNIRVPGFASDEIRAVRKVAPALAWTQKLNAVQAAKVTGGKGE